MLKFELFYRVDQNAILIPDLLNIQEPAIDISADSPLRFIFEYGYLPKSIMPRFIVRMHRDIKARNVWRTGVELSDNNLEASAVVRSDEKSKKVEIIVVGKQKRDYFATIRKVISDINGSFEKLSVVEWVPLPDRADVLIEYRDLLGHEIAQREEVFVGKVARAYPVRLLLDGIENAEQRRMSVQTLINLPGGTYVNHNSGLGESRIMISNGIKSSDGPHASSDYQAHLWEKIVSYLMAVLIISVVLFLLIRNQPINEPNLVIALRLLLSLMVATLGAAVPGMLNVDWKSSKGLSIRATGALALFVLSFLVTPRVIEHPPTGSKSPPVQPSH